MLLRWLQLEKIFKKLQYIITMPQHFSATLQRNEIFFVVWEPGGSRSHKNAHYESQWDVMAVKSGVYEHIEPEALTFLPFGCSAVEHSNDIHSVRDLIHWIHDGVLSQRLLLNT